MIRGPDITMRTPKGEVPTVGRTHLSAPGKDFRGLATRVKNE